MAIHVGTARGPERTRALLEEIAGGRRAAQLRAQVAAAKRGATREQVEEAFQEACLKAARSCRGQTMGEVYKWLLRTTDSTVDDMRDRLKREVLVDHSAREFQTVDSSLAPPEEALIDGEERAELDALTRAIFERLDARERNVAVLHSHGLRRKEIARHLGVTPRIVKRDVEGILTTGREQLAKAAGCGCADGHHLICRYAFGLAAGGEARRAQGHLASCGRCATMYERLDLWRERVAALLPVPPATVDGGVLVERVVHAGGDALTNSPPAGGGGGLRGYIAHAAGHVRDHATALLVRAGDPTPLAGARPGAVAAAVAGCLAVGGGATYCVQQSTDPISALTRIGDPAQREKPKNKPRVKRAVAETAPAVPVIAPVAPPPPPPPPPPAPAPASVTTTQPQLPPAPEDEFEPSSVSATQAPRQSLSQSSRKPAPAPADGIGEFDGP